jgi:hypothetical protein
MKEVDYIIIAEILFIYLLLLLLFLPKLILKNKIRIQHPSAKAETALR